LPYIKTLYHAECVHYTKEAGVIHS